MAEEKVEYALRMEQLVEAAKAEPVKKCKHRSLAIVDPASVVVECLFSRAKLIMAPHRRGMDPQHSGDALTISP